MKWFGKTGKTEPGWLVVAERDGQLSFVHGAYAGSGKAAVTRYGESEPEEYRGVVGQRSTPCCRSFF